MRPHNDADPACLHHHGTVKPPVPSGGTDSHKNDDTGNERLQALKRYLNKKMKKKKIAGMSVCIIREGEVWGNHPVKRRQSKYGRHITSAAHGCSVYLIENDAG